MLSRVFVVIAAVLFVAACDAPPPSAESAPTSRPAMVPAGPDGKVYRAKQVVFQSDPLAGRPESAGVSVARVVAAFLGTLSCWFTVRSAITATGRCRCRISRPASA